MNAATRRVLTALLAALAPASITVAWLALRAEVPDPLPTHWDFQGQPDDTSALGVLFSVTLSLAGALAVAVVVELLRARPQRADRRVVAATTWAAWLTAMVFLVPVLAARGSTDARAVELTWWAIAAVPVLPTVVALLVVALQPVEPAGTPKSAPASSLRIGDNERVAWVGSSSATTLLVMAGALLVGAVFLVFKVWPLAVLVTVVALVLFWVHVITVRVDDRAVTVGWGPARWPRLSIPVDEIVSARTERIEPTRWGGWGYRVSRRGTAAITRGGPGLVLERRGRRTFAVTVDHPHTATELVNALVDRRARTGAR
jgi:hypothetical protein